MNKQEVSELSLYLKSLPRLADSNKDERIATALADFPAFIKTYFHHHVDFAETETSVFRRWVEDELLAISRDNKKIEIDAYRGAAKTTKITQLFTLWKLARKEIRFGVLISASSTLSGLIFDVYKTELEENQNFKDDFNITMPSVWREQEIVIDVDGHLCKLAGYGAGAKIRGLKFLSWRPDWIILDDIENDENVESKAQRMKLEKWFKKVVLKLPARKKNYCILAVGTILHEEGLLKSLAKREDFLSFSFPLVIKFPDDIDNPDSIAGLVLDDHEIDGCEVMAEYYEDKDSFLSEYQGQPSNREGLLFDGYTLVDVMPKCDVYWIGLDPSMGKKKGDYFGIAVLGKKGDQYIASVKGYRMSPTKLIPRIIALYVRLQKIAPTSIACEVVAFQEFFKDTLKKEAKSIGVELSIHPLRNTAPKDLRIESIAPLVNDGTIQVCATDHLLIEEMDKYTGREHVDLLDALEMAYRIVRRRCTMNYKSIREKLKKRGFGKFKNKYA